MQAMNVAVWHLLMIQREKTFYSFGGYTNDGRSRSEFRVFENNNWKELPGIPGVIAAEPGLVYDSQRDRLITFGGSSAPGKINSDTWEWMVKNGKNLKGKVPTEDKRLRWSMMNHEKKQFCMVAWVQLLKLRYDETWEYDGKSWQQIPVTGPGQEYLQVMLMIVIKKY
jgi:hypothetical protein